MAVLRFRNVNKIYANNVQAVFDFNLDIEDKEFVVFVGPSGCGKSTTLRMVAGLEEISSGEIYIDDVLINDVPPKDRNIAMVFQNYALYPHMTVFDNMAFSLQMRKDLFPVYKIENAEELNKEIQSIEEDYKQKEAEGVSALKAKKAIKEEIKDFVYRNKLAKQYAVEQAKEKYKVRVMTYDHDKVEELHEQIKKAQNEEEKAKIYEEIEKVRANLNMPAFEYRHYTKNEITEKVVKVAETIGLEQYLKRKPGALSGGQRQRVALGRAIVRNPKVFLMDEPLSNLDAKLRGEMRTELKRLHNTSDCTFIYVTHDQLEAMTLATRICLMNNAVINQLDAPLTVYKKPVNLFAADFVGNPTMNFIPGKIIEKKENEAIVEFLGVKAKYKVSEQVDGLNNAGEKIVIGIRPEFLPIKEKGMLSGLAYSTLPTGMETTVKIDFGGDILSAVVFGSIDYAVDEEIRFDVVGDSIILFDAKSKKNLCLGSIEILEIGERSKDDTNEEIELIAEGSNPNANVDESKKGFFKKLFGKKKVKEEKAKEPKEEAEENK